MKKVLMLTWTRLREVLEYDPETGLFIRLISYSDRYRGKIAGCLAKPHGYWMMGIDGVLHQGHRLAWFYMTGSWPKHEIDHINGIKYDNRWVNLREATSSQNKVNRRSGSKTGLAVKRGVYKRHHRYEAAIKINGKSQSLGMFLTPEEAHEAYWKVAQKLHGKFARSE